MWALLLAWPYLLQVPYIIAEKEIKILELETLFMLVNILCYRSLAPDF